MLLFGRTLTEALILLAIVQGAYQAVLKAKANCCDVRWHGRRFGAAAVDHLPGEYTLAEF